MADSYPNLDKSLKGIIVAGYFTELRRLDMWIWYFGIGSLFVAFGNKYWLIIVIVSLVFLALSHFLGGYRRKDFTFAALM